MRKTFLMWGCLVAMNAWPGDRVAVVEVADSLPVSWNDALFSIDIDGPTTDGDAILNQTITVEHEAAMPGFTTYVRVNSHGEMMLSRFTPKAAVARGTDSYVVTPPLGGEQLIVLFSSAPLDQFFVDGANVRAWGSDRASAQEFSRSLGQLESAGLKVAIRRAAYTVAAAPGGTEYTTRSIERRVTEAAPVRNRSGGTISIPSRVEFEFNSDRLTEQGERDLDVFGDALVSKLRDRVVLLEGHTDSVGTDDYNNALSQRRAQAARQYLTQKFGIAETRISAVGRGKEHPLAPNETEETRARNRRVDFTFYDPASNTAKQ